MMLTLHNNIIIIENENPLIDLPIDDTHCPHTRSLTKPNSKPVTLLHVVPTLDIPSDDL